jgi:hypothetical protein
MRATGWAALMAAVTAGGCMASVESAQTEDEAAEAYVKLVLAWGRTTPTTSMRITGRPSGGRRSRRRRADVRRGIARAVRRRRAPHTEAEFQASSTSSTARLPGDGPLIERYAAFRRDFVIPPAQLDARSSRRPSRRAASARAEHIALPPGESFTVEYVTGKSWSGYNWYQGDFAA